MNTSGHVDILAEWAHQSRYWCWTWDRRPTRLSNVNARRVRWESWDWPYCTIFKWPRNPFICPRPYIDRNLYIHARLTEDGVIAPFTIAFYARRDLLLELVWTHWNESMLPVYPNHDLNDMSSMIKLKRHHLHNDQITVFSGSNLCKQCLIQMGWEWNNH